jgi:hypothetical protein
MKYISIYLIALAFFAYTNCNSQTDILKLKAGFNNPPKQYYPMPFWFINGELTNEGIVQQMTDAKTKANFRGVAVVYTDDAKPVFLSEAYFEKYSIILETAKKLDMNVILYDDTEFPSGTAGGKFEKKYPQDVAKSLEKRETIIKGPKTFKSYLPEGKLLAAVAMNVVTMERINLGNFIEENILNYEVPAGEWRIMFFMCIPGTFYRKNFAVDYLDTTAVTHFISLTYGEYAKRFRNYFNNTIQLTFFDDVGFLTRERTWTNAFNEKFIEINGFDPAVYYPALWYNIGAETEAARVAFFNTRAELLAEGYPKMVAKWSNKYSLKSTGHPPGNWRIQPVDLHGDIFKFYRYTDIPLTDLIIDYRIFNDAYKLISSASDLYDRPITATEIYGAFNENIVDPAMLYRALMEQQTRGVNFVIPASLWYDPGKVSIPPLVSPYSQKLGPSLPEYSDYVGRTCYMLQGGRRVADIALIYPIASLQGGYYFDSPDNKRAGTWAYPEADYLKISGMLTNDIRRDFTFVHPEYLATNKYSILKGKLRLENVENYQDYNLVIIPGGKVISVKALQKIKQFYDNGGKVIATTFLPSISAEMGQDQQIVKIIAEIFGANAASQAQLQSNKNGGKAIFIREPTAQIMSSWISELLPDADVRFAKSPSITSKLGEFSYLHKIHNDKDIYFFVNSSDDKIETDVLLRGRLRLESWNPHNGIISNTMKLSYVKIGEKDYTKCSLSLQPVNSVFWVEN